MKKKNLSVVSVLFERISIQLSFENTASTRFKDDLNLLFHASEFCPIGVQ